MNKKKQSDYLEQMEIEVWSSRQKDGATLDSVVELNQPIQTLAQLKQRVAKCELCELSKTRKNTVFGAGNEGGAKLMLVGEAPGANEDEQGQPFVGRAGKLLTAMLNSVEINREQIYIANVIKCRPPNNQVPSKTQMQLCTAYLKEQIVLVAPKLLVALGRVATQFLLQTDSSMASLRGKRYLYPETKTDLLVTYHPAYLLRSPLEKRKAYEDLLLIKQTLAALD